MITQQKNIEIERPNTLIAFLSKQLGPSQLLKLESNRVHSLRYFLEWKQWFVFTSACKKFEIAIFIETSCCWKGMF